MTFLLTTFNKGAKADLKIFYSHSALLEVAYLAGGGGPRDLIWGYNKEYLDYNFGLEISFKMKICLDSQNRDWSFW